MTNEKVRRQFSAKFPHADRIDVLDGGNTVIVVQHGCRTATWTRSGATFTSEAPPWRIPAEN